MSHLFLPRTHGESSTAFLEFEVQILPIDGSEMALILGDIQL